MNQYFNMGDSPAKTFMHKMFVITTGGYDAHVPVDYSGLDGMGELGPNGELNFQNLDGPAMMPPGGQQAPPQQQQDQSQMAAWFDTDL